jgi:hypothetical protein
MANQSLARIMYGTSEEVHSSTEIGGSALASLMAQSASDKSGKTASEPEPLGELLHKAWINLTGKH